ncbi:SusC/RagA family TonB-linked outer membrane protein [Seonamhaeicola sp.]|uniref:SusC/RagA family TonB-linked outer membrane protein n=1 Tax=Seonamhaeicola sp. TaxID=1912245 RepID=UPI002623A3CF|nr:SusC/RagA family TonB-linked outer membrane protein [Seonamhaeicola sp.]
MTKKVLKLLLAFGLLLVTYGMQAQITVKGTVTNAADNMGLPGANVVIKGTSQGVSTDFDGNYSIEVSDANAILQFSYVGFSSQEIAVNGQTTINVALQEDASQLDEVVVTALGIRKETKALGYSITKVEGEQVSLVKETNAINGLQGKIAGVNITQNSTGAAGSSRVIIRGNTSLTGENQPLYVIDGIPMGNDVSGSASLWGGNDGGDGVSSLNPDDIESMSVLKGGAAAALYGSRASNGVIMITTKTGKGQKGIGVEINSTTVFDVVDTSLQDFQTSYGQGSFGAAPLTQEDALNNSSSWGSRLDGSSVVQFDGVSRPYSYTGNNLKKFYRTGTTFTNTVALSGSNDKSNFRFSATDLSNQDIMPNASLNRKSFSLNLGSQLGEKLTLTVNAKYIREGAKNRPRLSDAPGNGNFSVMNAAPNINVLDYRPGINEDGTEFRINSNIFNQNPYWAAFHFNNMDARNRFIGSFSVRYDVLDWLYINARVGTDTYARKSTATEPWGTAYKPLGAMEEWERRYSQTDSDLMIGIDRDINDQFAVSAFVGGAQNTQERENLKLRGEDFVVAGLEHVQNTSNQTLEHQYFKKKINSLYGSLEVSYNDYLYLTGTVRNDWFSTLSFPGKTTPNNDLYYSGNLSFILSDALELPEVIRFAKFRTGYSKVAGGADNPYELALVYGIDGSHLGQPFGGVGGSDPNQIPLGDLVAYNVDEFEVGLDTRLLDGKLSLDLAYYSKETTNDIVPVGTSSTSGYSSALANIGKISNKGFEMLISARPVSTDDFSWQTTYNLSINNSEVVATDAANGDIQLGRTTSNLTQIRHFVGQPYGTIYGTSYVRDDNGNIVYENVANGVPHAVRGEYKILGEGVPPTTMGWTNEFRYKNFNLSFLIDAKFGGQIFSSTNRITTLGGLHKQTLEGRENGLTVTGTDVDTGQQFTATVAPEDLAEYWSNIGDISEAFIQDADYIKLRQISLGYTIPSTFLEKFSISSASVSVIGSNLFYLLRDAENIDPESSYQVGNGQGLEYFGLPSARRYGVSLNVKF